MTDRELLALAVGASGRSTKDYAEHVLLRNRRTVERWLSGESPIPHEVREYLLTIAPQLKEMKP